MNVNELQHEAKTDHLVGFTCEIIHGTHSFQGVMNASIVEDMILQVLSLPQNWNIKSSVVFLFIYFFRLKSVWFVQKCLQQRQL